MDLENLAWVPAVAVGVGSAALMTYCIYLNYKDEKECKEEILKNIRSRKRVIYLDDCDHSDQQ